jgi:hypothetical protein
MRHITSKNAGAALFIVDNAAPKVKFQGAFGVSELSSLDSGSKIAVTLVEQSCDCSSEVDFLRWLIEQSKATRTSLVERVKAA